MIRRITRISIWGYLAIMLLYSCGDSTSIGADIFSGDEIDVRFVDTIGIKAKTVSLDSFTSAATVLMLGNLDDPTFGKTRAEVVAKIDNNGFSALSLDTDLPYRLDSLVLIMAASNDLNYGDTLLNNISLDVFQVEQDLPEEEVDGLRYYSNAEIEVNEEPIGSVTDYLVNYDSTLVFNPLVDSVIVSYPQIRVPMKEEFVEWFRQEVLDADVEIGDVLKGIKISPSADNDLMTSVNFNVDQGTRLRMFYRQSDSIVIYDYVITNPAFNVIETDPSGTHVATALDNIQIGDSVLYLQPLQGTQVELDVSNLNSLQGTYINEVRLDMTLIEDNVGNLGHFAPISLLKASVLGDEGVFIAIEDIPSDANAIELFFGGNLTEASSGIRQYSMNITQFVKNSLAEDSEIQPLFINGFLEGLPNRSVIFGPGHMLYPMKLKVTYTLP